MYIYGSKPTLVKSIENHTLPCYNPSLHCNTDFVYTKYVKVLIDSERVRRIEQFMFHKRL